MHAVFISSDAEVYVDPRVCVTCAGHFLDIIRVKYRLVIIFCNGPKTEASTRNTKHSYVL